MGQSGLPTTLIICCSLPQGLPQSALEACIDAARRVAVPVTWAVGADQLPMVASALASHPVATRSRGHVALSIPPALSRQELRQLLSRTVAEFPGLEGASIHGPLAPEQRQVMVAGGIRVLCRDRIDDIARGSRRPAPSGWRCRSSVWGLWEVTRSAATPPGLIGRLLPWGTRPGPGPGSLSVLDLGGNGPFTGADSIRGQLEQWRSWAERREAREQTTFAALSDLPDLIAGGGRLPVSGSVLRAA